MTISVAVIVGDDTHAGLATICSLINQTLAPSQLVVVENPLRRIRLTERFSHFTSLLAYAHTRGIKTSLLTVERVPMVEARILAEDSLTGDLLMISDGDHFYPSDYLYKCEQALSNSENPNAAFYGCAVDCFSSVTGLTESIGQLVMDTHDYVSGGSFVYKRSYKGLWREVLKYTVALGEDRVWRALCVKQGGVKVMPREVDVVCHLSTHNSSKYPPIQSAELITLCEKHLGKQSDKNP